jgi:hypothetical protein
VITKPRVSRSVAAGNVVACASRPIEARAPTIAHRLGVALPKALGKPIATLIADKPR